jgi:hypothetical protein
MAAATIPSSERQLMSGVQKRIQCLPSIWPMSNMFLTLAS